MAHKADSDTGGAPLSGEDYSAFPTSGIGDAPADSDEPFDEGEYESQSHSGDLA
jgi:hypothetical protein